MPLQRRPVHRFSQYLDKEGSWARAGRDHSLEHGTSAWSVADHLERNVVAVHRMIKNPMLIEQRSQVVGHRSTPQTWKIGIIWVEPDRNLAVSVGEDHGAVVVAAATSHARAGAEEFGTASGRPINCRRICRCR